MADEGTKLGAGDDITERRADDEPTAPFEAAAASGADATNSQDPASDKTDLQGQAGDEASAQETAGAIEDAGTDAQDEPVQQDVAASAEQEDSEPDTEEPETGNQEPPLAQILQFHPVETAEEPQPEADGQAVGDQDDNATATDDTSAAADDAWVLESSDASENEGQNDEGPLAGIDARAAAAQAGRHIANVTRGAAAAGSRTVNEGISAMRELSRAKRAHGEARGRLEALEAQIARDEETLARRRDIEDRYEEIIAAQNAELESASAALAQAQASQAAAKAEHDEVLGQLGALKKENGERLSPYKKAHDAAKGALDEAERAYSEARRALKTAQAQYDAASNNKDVRLATANRNADNAAAKLNRLQDQLATLKRDDSATAQAAAELTGAVAAALAQLENAREDVTRAGTETQQAIEIAQTHLFTQRTSLEEAERDLARAREDESRKRSDYEAIKARTDATERELTDRASDIEARAKAASDESSSAQDRIEEARRLIDEAEDVRAHPDVTEALAIQLADNRAAADLQHLQVETLAEEERAVRERTRRQRLVFLAALAVLLVVAVAVFLVVTR